MNRTYKLILALMVFLAASTAQAATVQLSNQGPAIKQALDAIGAVGGQNAAAVSVGLISASDLIQVGQSVRGCGTSAYGSMRWNPGNNTIQQCTSAGWTNLLAGSVSSLANGASSIAVGSANTISFTINSGLAASFDSTGKFIPLNGISATGTVTATAFVGNGAGLTNLPAGTPSWYTLTNIPSAVQAVSNSGNLAMANVSVTNLLQVAQSSQACANGISGSLRFNTTSNTLQICTGSGWASLSSSTTGATASTAGSNTQVQFNNNGQLGADANFTYVSGTGTLSTSGYMVSRGRSVNPSVFQPVSSRNPTADDTNLQGYVQGDYWNNISTGQMFQASNTTDPAMWEPVPFNNSLIGDVVSNGLVFAGGTTQMMVSYTGPLLNAQGAAGVFAISATNRVLDVRQMNALVGVSTSLSGVTSSITYVYDQSGNGNDISQTLATRQPRILNLTQNAIPAITFDGMLQSGLPNTGPTLLNTSMAVQTNNMTSCVIGRLPGNRAQSLIAGYGYPTLGMAWANSFDYGLSLFPVPTSVNGNTQTLGTKARPSVTCMRTTPSGITWNQNDISRTITNVPVSNSVIGVSVGWTPSTTVQTLLSNSSSGSFDMLGMMVWNRTLTDQEIASVRAAAYAQFRLIPQRRKSINFYGDSITAGWGALGNQNNPNQLINMLGDDYELVNQGGPGTTALTWLVGVASVNSGGRMRVYDEQGRLNTSAVNIIALGTNDVAALNASPTPVYTSLTLIANALRTSMTTVMTTANPANRQAICLATVLPRSSFNAGQVISANALNILIRANTAGVDCIIDYASNTIIAAQPAVTGYYYFDGTHPTYHLYSIMAGVVWSAIKQWLP